MHDRNGSSHTISVIIPTWQRHKQLSDLLHSLHRQIRPPDEVLIVCREDDRQSLDAVATWSLGATRLLPHKLVTVQAPGHLPPLLAALECCKSDIFCLIDDDAIPRENWLQQLEQDFRDPSVGAIGGTIINHCDEDFGIVSSRPPLETPGKLSWFGRSGNYGSCKAGEALFEADCLVGCNMAFRRVAMDGCFDMVLNQGSAISYETDVALNIKRKGFGVYYDPAAVVDHYLTPRKISAQRGWNARECFVYAHNLTYICLKHLTWYGKLGFIVYFFLGGTWGCPGPVTYLLSFPKGRPASLLQQLVPAMKGRLCGIRSYYRNKRATVSESEVSASCS